MKYPRSPSDASSRRSSADETALVALSRGDRKTAIAILVQSYGRAIHRTCCRLLRNPTLADDIQQIVFIQAFESLDSFTGGASFGPWLQTIARHRCLDAIKARRRWASRFVISDQLPDAEDSIPPGEAEIAARSASQALEQCLAALPPHIRRAVLLRYEEGLSFEEMSRVCHERPGTLQARVSRALQGLRSSLVDRGIEP